MNHPVETEKKISKKLAENGATTRSNRFYSRKILRRPRALVQWLILQHTFFSITPLKSLEPFSIFVSPNGNERSAFFFTRSKRAKRLRKETNEWKLVAKWPEWRLVLTLWTGLTYTSFRTVLIHLISNTNQKAIVI